MRHTGLLFGLCLAALWGLTACKDNDAPPNEPMRHMDSGLQMPNRDAAADASSDDDAGDDDAGDVDGGQ